MKIAAVIAEYNPFHNGHLYQLDTLRQKLGTDRILVVMSGNFMQRGIPAITDKYVRAQMALANGADVVLELPVYYSLGSAEYFAQGAVSMLDKLGVVDILHFGSECGDIHILSELAQTLSCESNTYTAALRELLRNGDSFAAARSKAVSMELSAKGGYDFQTVMSQPNNTLGIEYIKAILMQGSAIRPVTLMREGNGYHAAQLNDELASASAIRGLLQEHAQDISQLADHVPASVYSALLQNTQYLFADDFSAVVYYKLLEDIHSGKSLADYYDITPQLADTFHKNLKNYTTLSQFCLDCKSRNVTYTRIARCLLHLLLDMKQATADALKADGYASYAHLLGFNSAGLDVLRLIKAHASIPVFTKLPDALKKLDGTALASLQADIYASQLYYGIQGQKYKHAPINEYRLKYPR